MNELTIEKAIQTLDSVCAQYKGTREDHVLLINSLNLVKQELEKPKEPEKQEETK